MAVTKTTLPVKKLCNSGNNLYYTAFLGQVIMTNAYLKYFYIFRRELKVRKIRQTL